MIVLIFPCVHSDNVSIYVSFDYDLKCDDTLYIYMPFNRYKR